MKRSEDMDIETGERRRARRKADRGTVRLTIDTTGLKGRLDNVSETGILFFTDDELRVTVHIEENGEKRTCTGTVARTQRLHGDSFGWAVEFDHD